MATREDNIKKINAQLEQMSDEELDRVAGGFYARSNVGDVKPDVNIDNQSRILHVRDEQSRIIHVR